MIELERSIDYFSILTDCSSVAEEHFLCYSSSPMLCASIRIHTRLSPLLSLFLPAFAKTSGVLTLACKSGCSTQIMHV